MSYDFACDFNLQKCIKKLGLEERGRVQQYVTNQVLLLSEPYVPFDEAGMYASPGTLKKSATIENSWTEIVWSTPYARNLYYHLEFNFQGAPMRGGYWVDRMLKNGGLTEIQDGARKMVGR